MPAKNSLRDKLEDDVLDLSLMQLIEVPVEEIVSSASVILPRYIGPISNDVTVNYFIL